MNYKTTKSIEISAIILSIVMTVLIMLYSANWSVNFGTILFILWAIMPYISVFFVGRLFQKLTKISKIPVIFCVVSILMLAATLFAYIGTIRNDSSTAALAFVFVPFYLFIGSFLLIGIGMIWAAFSKSKKKENVAEAE